MEILHSWILPAVHWNGSILPKLLLCFMNLANEVNKSFSRLWHSLLWPVSELELPHCSGLTVLSRENHKPSHREDARRIQPVHRPHNNVESPWRGKKTLGICLETVYSNLIWLHLHHIHIYHLHPIYKFQMCLFLYCPVENLGLHSHQRPSVCLQNNVELYYK